MTHPPTIQLAAHPHRHRLSVLARWWQLGNLFTTVLNTANTLKALENGFATVENNVANANTAGYATQTQTFQALPFDLSVGLPGGVSAGPVESSRNAYAEQAVR